MRVSTGNYWCFVHIYQYFMAIAQPNHMESINQFICAVQHTTRVENVPSLKLELLPTRFCDVSLHMICKTALKIGRSS